jgi:transcriptional regulator with XRE-family HTH domain
MDFELATTEQVLQELGERIRRQRLGQNLLQEDVAQRAGISVGALKRLEAGDNVRIDTLLNVAKSLSVLRDLEKAFEWRPAMTIADLERLDKSGRRVRARKKPSP